jgi:hypothetical protein
MDASIKDDLQKIYIAPDGRNYSDFPNNKEDENEENFKKTLKEMLMMTIINIFFAFIIIATYFASIEKNYEFLNNIRTEIYKKSEDIELYYNYKGNKNPLIYITLLPSVAYISLKKILIEYLLSFNVNNINNVNNVNNNNKDNVVSQSIYSYMSTKSALYRVTIIIGFLLIALLYGSILTGIFTGIRG